MTPRFLPLRSVIALLFLAHVAVAADWPRWRGPDANGHVPASAAVPEKLPAEAKVVWQQKVGFALGSPVVSAGKLFHIDRQETQEVVHALEAATGKEIWSVPLDEMFKDGQSAAGARSTPTVDGDRVYVTSCRGEFRCLDVADGRTVWRTNFAKDFGANFIGEKGQSVGANRHGNNASPMIVGDRIFVSVGGPESASVVCFAKKDGKVLWRSENDVAGYGGPVVATVAGIQQVLAFTADGAIGLRAQNGALLWRVPVKTAYARHVASPIVLGDLVIVGSHLAGNMGLRVSRDGEGCKVETAWLDRRNAINFSSPVLVGDYYYCLGPAGMMFCADAKTGEEKWTLEITAGTPKAQAQFVVMKKNILVLTDTGELLLVAADPAAAKVVSRLKVAGETWCNPAYADGKLFLRDKDSLMCVNLLP
jgi:outer membrane protein assembly factor BamB